MRNYDQVKRYHVDPILRIWPFLADCYHKTESKMIFPFENGPASEIHFCYAESIDDVVRRFRSGSYYRVYLDQSEQFTNEEISEVRQSVRWTNVPQGTCKLILAFNMGGASIDYHRKIFHLGEYNENESPDDYKFVHLYTWDNVMWSLPALKAEGLTEADYYSWPEEQRKEYCRAKSDYGKSLTSQDASLVKRDWEASWDSLEGAFFARAYDRNKTVLPLERIQKLIRPWWTRWISQDWGRGHYCATYWHARGEISPDEAKHILGWDLKRTLKVVVTYREYIAGGAAAKDEGGERELAESDIIRKIIEKTDQHGEMLDKTPWEERKAVQAFYLSPDAFAKRDEKRTIAQEYALALDKAKMAGPTAADTDVDGGWALMYNLMLETKRQGITGGEVWFISVDCPVLISSIPLLQRDPKNLDRVLKTDKSQAKIEQDSSESVRYGLKSMLQPTKKPIREEIEEQLVEMKEAGLDENSVFIHRTRLEQEAKKQSQPVQIGRRHNLVGRIRGF